MPGESLICDVIECRMDFKRLKGTKIKGIMDIIRKQRTLTDEEGCV